MARCREIDSDQLRPAATGSAPAWRGTGFLGELQFLKRHAGRAREKNLRKANGL